MCGDNITIKITASFRPIITYRRYNDFKVFDWLSNGFLYQNYSTIAFYVFCLNKFC